LELHGELTLRSIPVDDVVYMGKLEVLKSTILLI